MYQISNVKNCALKALRTGPAAIALAFFIVLSAGAAQAATFTVTSAADTVDAAPGDGICADAGGACTLRAAIGEANALAGADVINLPAGTYTTTIASTNEDANANGDFDITQNLTITGAGAATTIVQANAATNTATDRVFHNTAVGVTLVLENMTVRNGRVTSTATPAGRGGGIYNNGIMTLNNVTVQGNIGTQVGGGVYSAGTALNINNSNITGNTCTNAATCFGGGVSVITGSPLTSSVTVTGTTITGNTSIATTTAASSGTAAGLYSQNAALTVTGSNISNNTGSGTTTGGSNGTGIRVNSSAATLPVTITDTTINNNVGNTAAGSTHSGVGIAFNITAGFPINATLNNVTINGNTGTSGGAGVSISGVGGTFLFNNSTISNNTLNSAAVSSFGAGISLIGSATGSVLSSALTLNFCRVTGNNSLGTGSFIGLAGGIYNQGGTLAVNYSTVSGNTANFHAGIRTLASVVNATTTVNSSTVNNNTGGEGGGIVNIISATATLTTTTNIVNSTISGNSVTGTGGGIDQLATGGTGIVNITDSTIAFNAANSDNSDATGAESGGGIFNGSGTLNLRGSIVSNNTVGTGSIGPDIAGTITSGNFNLIQSIAGGTFAPAAADITGVDPLLQPLANNTGTTFTHALSAGSPAIDKGNAFGTTTDQRGLPRPVDNPGVANAAGGDGSDIGAFEVQLTTAAGVSIGGRVQTVRGQGIRNVIIRMIDTNGNSRTTTTSAFGFYLFKDVPAGTTYVLTPTAKQYTFSEPSHVLNASGDDNSINFTAN